MRPTVMNPKDLIVLVADNNMKATVQGILSRYGSLEARPIAHEIYVHVYHDPGCLRDSHNFLRPFINRFRFALVLFDRAGCGRDRETRAALEERVELNLSRNGWHGRAAAIVLDPELELWLWSGACTLEATFGWPFAETIRYWLASRAYIHEGELIPRLPKEAMEEVLRKIRRPRSSSIYLQLARTANYESCREPAFMKFTMFLRNCFQV